MAKKVSKLESQNTAKGVRLIAYHRAHGGREFRGAETFVSRVGLTDAQFREQRALAIRTLLAANEPVKV